MASSSPAPTAIAHDQIWRFRVSRVIPYRIATSGIVIRANGMKMPSPPLTPMITPRPRVNSPVSA